MNKKNSKIVVINIFGNSIKEKLSTSTPAPIFGKNVEDDSIIETNIYYLAC